MTRFFVFLILLSAELYSSDRTIAAMAKTLESGKVTSNGYVMSGGTFDYLREKISEKLGSKLSSQLISPASKSRNAASTDLPTEALVQDVINPPINVTEYGFRASEKNFAPFDVLFDILLGLIPSFEIPHDPVALDAETWTGNSTESNRNPNSNKISTE